MSVRIENRLRFFTCTVFAALVLAGCCAARARAAADCGADVRRLSYPVVVAYDEAHRLGDEAARTSDLRAYVRASALLGRVVAAARAKHLRPLCLARMLSDEAFLERGAGQTASAVRDLKLSIALSPPPSPSEAVEDDAFLAEAFGADGRMADAVASDRAALQILARNPDPAAATLVNLDLGFELMRSGSFEESYRVADALGDSATDVTDKLVARVTAAAASRSLGRPADANAELTKGLATAGDDPSAAAFILIFRALFDVQDERFGDAETDLKTIVDREAGADDRSEIARGSAQSLLGYVYLGEDRVDDARATYQAAETTLRSVSGPAARVPLALAFESEALIDMRYARYAEARAKMAAARPLVAAGGRDLTIALGANPIAVEFAIVDGSAALGMHRYADAEADYANAARIGMRVMQRSPFTAIALADLSTVKRFEGDCSSARRYLFEARSQTTAAPNEELTGIFDLDRAVLAYYCRDRPAAASAFAASFADLEREFAATFAVLGERERLAFAAGAQTVFDGYLTFGTFGVDRTGPDPAVAAALYDVALFRKGLVARSIDALEARARRSSDPVVTTDFANFLAGKKALAALASSPADAERGARIDELTKKSEALLAELSQHFPELANDLVASTPHASDVRAVLKPGEAAVEIVRFGRIAARSTSGPPWYVALIQRADRPAPIVVDLGAAAAIEGDALAAYRRFGVRPDARLAPGDAGPLARLAWTPISRKLGGVRTVYLSADGVLCTVAFDLLQAQAPGPDEAAPAQIVLVDSTGDLTRRTPANPAKAALLFGDPRFDLSADAQRAALARAKKPNAGSILAAALPEPVLAALRGVSNDEPLPPLAGTATEVGGISRLLRADAWNVQAYTGSDALEETLETQAHGQRLVHLATHGVFLPDTDPPHIEAHLPSAGLGGDPLPREGDVAPAAPLPDAVVGTPDNDPMFRSLLFFAGADRAWAEHTAPPPGLDSGVLTASEAGTLDLHGTELVVLSACETGLGSVRSGDGVLGLRRALRQAGAREVLMSLWRLPDEQTAELMTTFYKHWLAGEDAHVALRAAQAAVANQSGSSDPYYWAGLVVVGAPASTSP